MNNTTISLKDMINYIWEKKIFLIIWILVITSLFAIYSFRIEQSFKANVRYTFPIPERYNESISELINFYEKGNIFHKDVYLLKNSDVMKYIIEEYNLVIKKEKGFTLRFSITGSDSTAFRDKLQRIEILIDSLYIATKIQKYNEDIDRTYAKILEMKVLKESLKNNLEKRKEFDQYAVIEKELINYYEFLIVKKYSYEILPDRDYKKIGISKLSINKLILIIVGFIFSIWSGLMIIVIRYFVKFDSKKISRNVKN